MKEKIKLFIEDKQENFKKPLYCIIKLSVIFMAILTIGGIYATNNAFSYANLSSEQISYVRFEFEFDDFIPQYEVRWHEGREEKEYTIHALTGKLMKIDR